MKDEWIMLAGFELVEAHRRGETGQDFHLSEALKIAEWLWNRSGGEVGRRLPRSAEGHPLHPGDSEETPPFGGSNETTVPDRNRGR